MIAVAHGLRKVTNGSVCARERAFSFSYSLDDDDFKPVEYNFNGGDDGYGSDLEAPPELSRGPSPMPSPSFEYEAPMMQYSLVHGPELGKDVLEAWTREIAELERDLVYALA